MISGVVSFEQMFVGTCQATLAASYLYQFGQYLRPRESEVRTTIQLEETDRDRIVNRITSGVNAVGSVSRLADWVLDQGWVIAAITQAIAVKILAHVTGVFFYIKNSLDIIESIEEIEGFLHLPERMRAYDPLVMDSMMVYKYSRWVELFSNIVLGVYSGIQLGSLMVGVIVLTPTVLNLFLTAGFVCVVFSTVLKFGSTTAVERLDFLRAASPGRYTFYV